jgi:hypothetical protein
LGLVSIGMTEVTLTLKGIPLHGDPNYKIVKLLFVEVRFIPLTMKITVNKFLFPEKFFEQTPDWQRLKEPTMNQMAVVGTIMAVIVPTILFLIFKLAFGINKENLRLETGVRARNWSVTA